MLTATTRALLVSLVAIIVMILCQSRCTKALALLQRSSRLGGRPNPATTTTVAFLSSSSASEPSCPLPFETLPYRGAAVRLDRNYYDNDNDDDDDNQRVPSCNDQFLKDLQVSLEFWKENDYTSAWLHIPTHRASLIELLQLQQSKQKDDNSGDHDGDTDHPPSPLAFDLHHVNATENTIVLKQWLRHSYNEEDKIPPFATHQVGCAGFVLSDQNELLLVKEWTGPRSDRTPTKQWKLPGGLLDIGETFGEASCREVYEETGVECEFESVLAFWHRHGLMFGKSDFYYVCLLTPKNKKIDIDPVEVSNAVWMPIPEFLETQDHPLIHHVLKHVFDLDKDRLESLEGRIMTDKRLEPVIEMLEGHVQFGNRTPHLTYTGRTRRDGGGEEE